MIGWTKRHIARVKSRISGFPNVSALTDAGMKIGVRSYLGKDVLIDPGFAWLISIGDHTILAPRAMVIAHDASTRKLLGYTKMAPVTIGSYVYIGVGAIILPGVTIGDRSIIAAGAVVRNDVVEGSVVAGNPAEVVAKTDEYLARQQLSLDEWLAHIDELGISRGHLHPSASAHLAATREYMDESRWGYVE